MTQLKNQTGLYPGQLPVIPRGLFCSGGVEGAGLASQFKKMHVKFCKTRQACSSPSSPAERAFTLAEVMVAVLVLAVAAISLYSGFATGFMIVDSTRQELRATQILTQKSEAIRLCSWSSLTNCPISFTEVYDPTSPNGSSGTRYVGTISTNDPSVIPNSMSYRSNMCLATITLFWTNYNGSQRLIHSRTAQTLIARYGIQNYIWGAQ
jgi:prepilin-type N-terminal cleavage/methylation domain-containing protein